MSIYEDIINAVLDEAVGSLEERAEYELTVEVLNRLGYPFVAGELGQLEKDISERVSDLLDARYGKRGAERPGEAS